MHAAAYDTCECGDYRHQHDEFGCTLCAGAPFGFESCNRFRLMAVMKPTWRYLTSNERGIVQREAAN